MYSKYGRAGGGGKRNNETPIFITTKIMMYNKIMKDNTSRNLNYMGIALLVWLIVVILLIRGEGYVYSGY